MSVIFNSLRKMQEGSSVKKDNRKILRTKQKAHFFNKTFFSPKFVAVLSVGIFLIGFAVLYGVQVLKNQVGQKKDESVRPEESRTNQPESVSVEVKKNIVNLVTPKMPAPPGADTANVHTPARYLPPRPDLDIVSEPAASSSPSTIAAVGKDVSSTKKKQAAAAPPPYQLENLPESVDTSPDQGILKPDSSRPDTLTRISRKPRPIPRDKPELNTSEQTNPQRNVFAVNAQKSSDISRLVIQFRRAMQGNDDIQANEIIKKLTQLKGEENSYVLKIKAFWYIRKGDYETAGAFLNKVLEKNESDLEAGINMAVVEIKTAQFKKARSRLMQLQEIYPYNTQIPELIQRLKF